MTTSSQIHVPTAGGTATLAARHGADGTWLLSTFTAPGSAREDAEIYIPAGAAVWLAGVAAAMVPGTILGARWETLAPQAPSPPDVSLAGRLRAIAATPSPAAIAELLRITAEVARIEYTLDEIVADALETVLLDAAHTKAERGARAHRASRRRARLTVVQ